MILSHEIPQGSKLYFGKSAKIKRDLENLVSSILYQNHYEEIVTPIFSFLQYQRNAQSRKVVRVNNQYNQPLALRNDSTIDTFRLIAPHLKEKSMGKKWFYIQPIFIYPTTEIHQIGVENLEEGDILPFIAMSKEILEALNLKPFLQLSNAKIPQICAKEFGLDYEIFSKNNINILSKAHPFLAQLLEISHLEELDALYPKAPQSLQEELKKLCILAKKITYTPMILAPLCPSPMPYYDGVFFRFFLDNATMILGGEYEMERQRACGFGIYTDCVILSYKGVL